MTKIRDVRSEIEDLEITMDEAVTIQVLNSLDFFFAKFLGILSNEAREKEKLPTLESLAKSLEDEELRMKNQDKATANHAKRFTKEKGKPSTRSEDSEDSTTSLISKCKFCEKKHEPNECWHLQAECHYCHKIRHIAKFCKKIASPQASPRRVVTGTKSVPCLLTPLQPKRLASCTVNAKFPKSSVEKIIIDSGATDHFFQIANTFPNMKNTTTNFKPALEKYLQHMGMETLSCV